MKKLLLFLPVLFLAISCDKDDDDDTPSEKTKTDLITQTSWKLETAGQDNDKNGQIDLDLTALIEPCILDNTLKFNTGGTGSAGEGATKCSASAPDSTPFTWAFANNETSVNITGNAVLGFGGQYSIVALSDTRLSLSKDTTITGLGATTLLANFTH